MTMHHAVEDEHALELRKEASTMGLYVAICLLAALTALPTTGEEHASVLALVWGVTVGLALAHLLAFRVSARLVGEGSVRAADMASAGAQLTGAVVVAALASATVLVIPAEAEARAVTLVLATAIGAFGFAVARGGGAARGRALAYAAIVLALAVVVVELKNRLAGH